MDKVVVRDAGATGANERQRRSSTIGVDRPLEQTAENVLNVPDMRVSLCSVPETWIGHGVLAECNTSVKVSLPRLRAARRQLQQLAARSFGQHIDRAVLEDANVADPLIEIR